MVVAVLGLQAVPVMQRTLATGLQRDVMLAGLRGGGLNGRELDEGTLAAHGDPLMLLLAGGPGLQASRDHRSAVRSTPLRLKLRAAVTGGKTSPREAFEPTVEDLLLSIRGNRKRKYQSKLSRDHARAELAADRRASNSHPEHTQRMDKRASRAPMARAAVDDGVTGGNAHESARRTRHMGMQTASDGAENQAPTYALALHEHKQGSTARERVNHKELQEKCKLLELREGADGDRVVGDRADGDRVRGVKGTTKNLKRVDTGRDSEKQLTQDQNSHTKDGKSPKRGLNDAAKDIDPVQEEGKRLRRLHLATLHAGKSDLLFVKKDLTRVQRAASALPDHLERRHQISDLQVPTPGSTIQTHTHTHTR